MNFINFIEEYKTIVSIFLSLGIFSFVFSIFKRRVFNYIDLILDDKINHVYDFIYNLFLTIFTTSIILFLAYIYQSDFNIFIISIFLIFFGFLTININNSKIIFFIRFIKLYFSVIKNEIITENNRLNTVNKSQIMKIIKKLFWFLVIVVINLYLYLLNSKILFKFFTFSIFISIFSYQSSIKIGNINYNYIILLFFILICIFNFYTNVMSNYNNNIIIEYVENYNSLLKFKEDKKYFHLYSLKNYYIIGDQKYFYNCKYIYLEDKDKSLTRVYKINIRIIIFELSRFRTIDN